MKLPCSASIPKFGIQNNITLRGKNISDGRCDGVLEDYVT